MRGDAVEVGFCGFEEGCVLGLEVGFEVRVGGWWCLFGGG